MFEAMSHADAEQPLGHGLGALLSGDEVDSAIEGNGSREVVIEIKSRSRQVLTTGCASGSSRLLNTGKLMLLYCIPISQWSTDD